MMPPSTFERRIVIERVVNVLKDVLHNARSINVKILILCPQTYLRNYVVYVTCRERKCAENYNK